MKLKVILQAIMIIQSITFVMIILLIYTRNNPIGKVLFEEMVNTDAFFYLSIALIPVFSSAIILSIIISCEYKKITDAETAEYEFNEQKEKYRQATEKFVEIQKTLTI